MLKNGRKTQKKANHAVQKAEKAFCTELLRTRTRLFFGEVVRTSGAHIAAARTSQEACADLPRSPLSDDQTTSEVGPTVCELKIKTRNGRSGPHLGELSRRGVVPGAVGTGQHSSLRGKNQREGPTGRKEVTGSSIPRLLTVRVYSLTHPRSHRFNQQSGRPVSTESPAGESVDPQSHR